MPPRGKKPEAVEVKYPHLSIVVCASPEKSGVTNEQAEALKVAFSAFASPLIAYCSPLTAVDAMTLLGWEVEQENGPKFGTDYLLTDRFGRKVRCHNNVRNRPLYMSSVEAYIQDVLGCKWELNGEPIIVSQTGIILNGQHQLVALVLAQQALETERDMDSKELRWAGRWPTGVAAIDKLIVYGIDGSDRVVNTMDTCKARSLVDVLYRAPFFADLPVHDTKTHCDRESAARITDYAIKHLWVRTGLYLSDVNSRRTHAVAVEWLEGHGSTKGKFVDCVREIMEGNVQRETVPDPENEGKTIEKVTTGRISSLVPLGYSVASLWLMACSDTNPERVEKYYDERDEKMSDKPLTWGNLDKAIEFWSHFGKEDGPLKALTKALQEIKEGEDEETAQYSLAEKNYLVVTTWLRFLEGKQITKVHMTLEEGKHYSKPSATSGKRTLINEPTTGGIDLGLVKIAKNKKDGQEPTQQQRTEVENGIEELKNGHTPPQTTPVTPSTNGDTGDGEEDNKEPLPLMLEVLRTLHKSNADVGPIFTKTEKGIGWFVWDAEATIVGEKIDKKPRLHPTRLLHLSFKPDTLEEVTDKLTDEGLVVGMAEEVAGKWELTRVLKPSKKKAGKK